MVYFHSSISVCNSVDQAPTLIMSNSLHSSDLHQTTNSRTNRKSSTVCDGSHSAAIDVVILIAVITACGFLFFPYVKLITMKLIEIFSDLSVLVKEEILQNPIVYGSLVLSVFCAAISTWLVILLCTMQRCGKPNCKGLRKAVEFDIQLETEECVKSSNSNGKNNNGKRGMCELPRVHHRELEADLC